MREEIRVKGSVLLGVMGAAERNVPKLEVTLLTSHLGGELVERIRTHSILATGWYPVAWHRALLGALVEHGGPIALREVVQRATYESVSSIHRLLVRALSPETLIQQGARLFSSFFEGTLVMQPREPGLTQIVWSGCHGFDKVCWMAQGHTVEKLVAMTGAKLKRRNVLAGGGDGDDGMVLQLSWFI